MISYKLNGLFQRIVKTWWDVNLEKISTKMRFLQLPPPQISLNSIISPTVFIPFLRFSPFLVFFATFIVFGSMVVNGRWWMFDPICKIQVIRSLAAQLLAPRKGVGPMI